VTDAPSQPARDTEPKPKDYRPGRRTRILDRRGQTLPICTVSDLPAGCDPALRGAVRRANHHRFAYIAATLAAMIILLIAIRLTLGKGSGGNFPWFMFYWFSIGPSSFLGAKQVDRNGRAALAALLKARLCPSCGYDLSAIPPDPDTFTTCPECGGAWPLQSVSPRS
jgi:hypothetical protein